MLLQFSNIIFLLMMPSILWSAQVPPSARRCHLRASRLRWCSSACKLPPFSSKHNDDHYSQTVLFLFHQTRGYFSKKYNLCPHVQLQTVGWLFYFCTGFLQHRHMVLCCCSGIDLHLSHHSTFISRRRNVSPSWEVWRLRGPMVFILAYCLYRWTLYLQAFGNCSQG